MKKKFILAAGILLLFFACSKSSTSFTAECDGTKSYATDVSPVIQSYCATRSGCHGSGSTNGPGALTSYAQVYSARNAIRTAVTNGTMPQNSSLSTEQKNSIICWIDSGASNN